MMTPKQVEDFALALISANYRDERDSEADAVTRSARINLEAKALDIGDFCAVMAKAFDCTRKLARITDGMEQGMPK